MRIALATSSYAPYVGGVEEHVRNVAAALSERGHSVAVWTIARDGAFAVRSVDGITVWDLPAPLPARSLLDAARFASSVGSAWRRWNRAYASLRPDVIHINCFGPNGTYATLLAQRRRTPFIVSSHGETLADDAGVFEHSQLAKTSLRRALTRASAVTGCSEVVLSDLESRFGLTRDTGVVVPNGIDLAESPAADPLFTGRYVAAVGRLQQVKGFDLLVRAFARAQLPADVRLVIGGDGPESASLLALATEHGIGDRVILPGRLDRTQVSSLMQHASAVAVPSRFEAFGIAALEAWRAGAPLVCTNRGGPPEFVTDGVDGQLCDPTDVDAFSAALRGVLSDPEHARSLAQNGHARVESFTWESTTRVYERLYARVGASVASAER